MYSMHRRRRTSTLPQEDMDSAVDACAAAEQRAAAAEAALAAAGMAAPASGAATDGSETPHADHLRLVADRDAAMDEAVVARVRCRQPLRLPHTLLSALHGPCTPHPLSAGLPGRGDGGARCTPRGRRPLRRRGCALPAAARGGAAAMRGAGNCDARLHAGGGSGALLLTRCRGCPGASTLPPTPVAGAQASADAGGGADSVQSKTNATLSMCLQVRGVGFTLRPC